MISDRTIYVFTHTQCLIIFVYMLNRAYAVYSEIRTFKFPNFCVGTWVSRYEIPTLSQYSPKSFRIYNFDARLVTSWHNPTDTLESWDFCAPVPSVNDSHSCGNSPASLQQNVRWLLGASSDGWDHLRRFQQFSLVSQCESKEPFLAAASPCPERQKGEMNARECSRSSRLISIAHPKQEFWQ